MNYRFLVLLVWLFSTQLWAAACLDVFPGAIQGNHLNTGNELTNIPTNNSNASLTKNTQLSNGDNFYKKSKLKNKDKVTVANGASARLYINHTTQWQNVKINQSGNPQDLIIIINGSLNITGGNTVINAIIYVTGAATVSGNASVNGAITALGAVSNNSNSLTYNSNAVNNANFNGMCTSASSATTPIAEFRFDETVYTGAAGEVTDSIGNYDGQAFAAQPSSGKVCNAADFNSTGTSDYILLNNNLLHGKTNFTVSLWAQTAKTSNQSLVSGAGSSSSNELIFWFTRYNSFTPYLKGFNNGSISVNSIADNNWHHLVWTRNGSQSCFYQDTVLQGCKTQSTGALNIQSLLLGQEQDSIGGRFSSSQAFDGKIDELLVYDSAISQADINTIYNNQNAGLGYDGSSRTCPVKQSSPPVLDLHFDELSWSGTNSVLDSSGNNFHATAVNATPTNGLLCNAADLSASGTQDYIQLNSAALNGKGDLSISLWLKSAKTQNQSLVSGSVSGSMNELIFWFTSDTSFLPHLKNTRSSSVTTSTIADNNWHHLVWTREGTQNCLYRDKVLQGCTSLNATPLSISSLILGQEQDSLGGGFDSNQALEGLLDEVLIFEHALSSNEVSSIYDNQIAGNNYDGTRRSSASCQVTPIANFQMDETSWNGTVGEVIDQQGNYNSTAKNGLSTASVNPAKTGNPGTCNYGSFDGVNDFIQLPSSFGNQTGSFTITAWINPSNLDKGSRIFIDDQNNTGGYGFSLGDPGSGKLRFYSRKVNPISVDTGNVIPANQWTFVAAVHDAVNKTRQIYVNGVAQTVTGGGTSNTYTGNWGTDAGDASIGGEIGPGETANRFTGLMDEVRFYDQALSSNEISTIFSETHACSSVPAVDHFEISHDGTGITCAAETVTIKACANADCSSLSTDAVSVDLQGNGATLTSANFTGSTTVSFNHTTAETLTLSVANSTITPTNNLVCKNGASNSCELVFANAGFQFLYGASNSTTIANQTAGASFADTLKIQAVKDSAGVCTALFNGNVTVDLAQQNVSPSGTGGLSFTVNGSAIAKAPSSTATTLNFGANSIATISNPIYNDAGQIQLQASYNASGVSLTGNSNQFWVAPNSLEVTAKAGTTSLNGNSNTSAITHKAGDNFTFEVTAKNALGVTTPNYEPGQIQLKLQRTGPTVLGEDGILTFASGQSLSSSLAASFQNVTLTSFVNGVSSYTAANYSEVGLINLDIQDSNYGGVGITVPANAIDIGRFVPDHFVQTVATQGVLTSACTIPTTFAYSGQKDEATNSKGGISYLTQPQITITAYNKQNAITVNYDQDTEGSANDYRKLVASDVAITAPTQDANNNLALTANLSTGTLTQSSGGVLNYQFNATDNFVYTHNNAAKVAPFTSAIEFSTLSVTDSDNVTATTTNTVAPTGIEIRFARMVLANSFGPETANITQPLTIEYFDGSNFVTDTDNNCSTFDASKLSLSNISLNPALTSVNGGTGSFISGKTQSLYLSATGAGNQGEIGVTYTPFDWFLYDWNGDGNYNNAPTAVATFGQYRGNDRVIYWREISK